MLPVILPQDNSGTLKLVFYCPYDKMPLINCKFLRTVCGKICGKPSIICYFALKHQRNGSSDNNDHIFNKFWNVSTIVAYGPYEEMCYDIRLICGGCVDGQNTADVVTVSG